MNCKICLIFCSSWLLLVAFLVKSQDTTFDVTTYGAKPGSSDIGLAFTNAWKDACTSTLPSTVVIPKGTFALTKADLVGHCKVPIHFRLEGTLQAPSDPSKTEYGSWINFNYVDRLTIFGGGTFDGQGFEAWKKNDCNKKLHCHEFPYNLSFNFVTNSTIRNVTTANSKNFHVNVLGCKNVTFNHFTVSAPGTSINTDGIHITKSKEIYVTNSTIKTGDDCISVGDGAEDLHITGVTCGPGHGISVGSLGKTPGEQPVRGVYVKNCTFIETQNGIRIKTWPASYEGLVTEVIAEDIIVQNASNPVIVDQRYCPWKLCNLQIPSKVKIRKLSFKNIRGTSKTAEAIKLDCSSMVPCEDVEVGDINITYTGTEGPIKATCSNVKPKLFGSQKPKLCTAPAMPFAVKHEI